MHSLKTFNTVGDINDAVTTMKYWSPRFKSAWKIAPRVNEAAPLTRVLVDVISCKEIVSCRTRSRSFKRPGDEGGFNRLLSVLRREINSKCITSEDGKCGLILDVCKRAETLESPRIKSTAPKESRILIHFVF